MPAVVTLTLSELAARIEAKGYSIASIDFTKPLKTCHLLIVASIKENFQGSHDPDGVPWQPLKRPRANSKGGDKPLIDTGALQASAQGGAFSITRNSLTLSAGSNLSYAAVHQYGHVFRRPERRRPYPQKPWSFTAPDGRRVFTRKIRAHSIEVPARPFAGFGANLVEKMEKILAEHAAKTVGDL